MITKRIYETLKKTGKGNSIYKHGSSSTKVKSYIEQKGQENYKRLMKEDEKRRKSLLNLEKKAGEDTEKYYHRLTAIYSTQVGIISKYEKEKELDRYRDSQEAFTHLLSEEDKESENTIKKLILSLQKEVNSYSINYPKLSHRKSVSDKLNDLASLI